MIIRPPPALHSLVWLLFALATACQLVVAAATGTVLPHIALVSVPLADEALPLASLAVELHQRGYRVSITLPQEVEQLLALPAGIHIIRLPSALDKHYLYQGADVRRGMHELVAFYGQFQQPMYEQLLPVLQASPPALLVGDRFTFAAFDLAHKLQLPLVINSAAPLLDVDSPPASVPAPLSGLPFHGQTVWQRLQNPLLCLQFRLATLSALRSVNSRRQQLKLPRIRYHGDSLGGALLLSNSVFGLEDPRARKPLVALVGPLSPATLPPLPASLQEWLDDSTSRLPTLLVQLGSCAALTQGQALQIVRGLTAAPVRVLWVLPKEHYHILPSELPPPHLFRLAGSVSRAAVVAHPAVRVLFTLSTLTAVQEALRYGKPLLAMPMLLDQWEVAYRLQQRQAGLLLHVANVTAARVTADVTRLLTDARFAAAARQLGVISSAAGGCKRAADLIDTVHALGLDAMRTMDARLPTVQLLMLDVFAVYGAVLCCVAVIMRTCWSTCWAMWGAEDGEDELKIKDE
eukprot:PLAT4394.6.p1 GENE.PLAT4394.6~~PLAT4394.6.p1  ORF type:complete len:519 (-),score=242.01 PLAT4394.6:65-1621(-)